MGSNQAEFSLVPGTTDEAATRIGVDVRSFRWTTRLAADYAYDFASVAPFFSGDPSRHDAWAEAIGRTAAQGQPRAALTSLLAAQQARRNAPQPARDSARLLADAATVAVLTGQQAGLFGGPLFTLLKALTALKLAARVSREHGVPAVAVFWVDAEDHDWNEVRSCRVFGEGLSPATISLPPRSAADPTPVASVQLDDTVAAALDELERVLGPTDFRAELLANLRAAYAPGQGMAAAFARWLEHVLGDRGLVVFESSDPAAKTLVSGVFARELSSPGDTTRLAAAAGAALEARGYHAQFQAQDDGVALFHLDGSRRAIRRENGHFVIGDERVAAEALIKRAQDTPGCFSPNVILRPIVQDTLFPTVCYVAGPNELAYLGQLRPVYERFGLPMPLMFPRASITLVDAAALRFLQKYKLPLDALQPQDESALNQLLQSQIPSAVEASFDAAAHAIASGMTGVIESIPVLDLTLEGAARSTLGKMQHDLSTLHGKMIQAAKRRDDTLRRQYLRAKALTFPDGHAQERTIGFASFLNQYGPALVDRLEHEVPLDLGRHWVVTI